MMAATVLKAAPPTSFSAQMLMKSCRSVNNHVGALEDSDPDDIVARRLSMHQLQTDPSFASLAPDDADATAQGTGSIYPNVDNRMVKADACNNFTRNFGNGPCVTLDEMIPIDNGLPGVKEHIDKTRTGVLKAINDRGVPSTALTFADIVWDSDPEEKTDAFAKITKPSDMAMETQPSGGTVLLPFSGDVCFPLNVTSTSVTSPFGARKRPTRGASAKHRGVDLSASFGTVVRSVAGGTVEYAGWYGNGGNTVKIRHATLGGLGGPFVTEYMHLSEIKVSNGQTVFIGQEIGRSGSTGVSTGNHLHFQLDRLVDKKEIPMDPLGLLQHAAEKSNVRGIS